MKPLFLALTLLLSVTACHAPVSVVTPQGQKAYGADQVVVRVNELMNAAIAANAATPPGLPTATTRTLVQFCVAADQTLAQVPTGWLATIQSAWTTAKQKLGPVTNPVITALMAALDAVLQGVAP